MLKLLSSTAAVSCCMQALAAPMLRTVSESSSLPFFKSLSELTGLNWWNWSLAHRRFFCSDSYGDGGNEGTLIEVDLAEKAESDSAETKSSSAIVHKSETRGLFTGSQIVGSFTGKPKTSSP